jgi:sec-independent protein translocase protein TatA
MCGLGHWELLLILGIVLLLFGAKKLPGLAAGLGQSLRAFKKSATETDELEEGKAAAPAEKAASAEEPKPDEPSGEKKA